MPRYRSLRLRRASLEFRLQTMLRVAKARTNRHARHLKRKLRAVRQQLQLRRQRRARHIHIQSQRKFSLFQKRARRFKLATWNTRGLGAPHGLINQELKIRCFISHMITHTWSCLVLTDLKFRDNGVRRYRQDGQSWYLVIQDKIGFLLDVWCYDWWVLGGSVLHSQAPRVAAISLPRRGWRRGLFVMGVYAPTSEAGAGARRTLRQQLTVMQGMAPATSLQIIAGDFNAEFGNNADHTIPGYEVMGPFSRPKTNPAGREWRQWLARHALRDAVSRYPGRTRCTWLHPRFLSSHELDHCFIRGRDLWHLQGGRILQEGPSVFHPWSPYTDHNPVEINLRFGKNGSLRVPVAPRRLPPTLPKCGVPPPTRNANASFGFQRSKSA